MCPLQRGNASGPVVLSEVSPTFSFRTIPLSVATPRKKWGVTRKKLDSHPQMRGTVRRRLASSRLHRHLPVPATRRCPLARSFGFRLCENMAVPQSES